MKSHSSVHIEQIFCVNKILYLCSIIKFDIWFKFTVDIVRLSKYNNVDSPAFPIATVRVHVRARSSKCSVANDSPSIVHKKQKNCDEGETNGTIRR